MALVEFRSFTSKKLQRGYMDKQEKHYGFQAKIVGKPKHLTRILVTSYGFSEKAFFMVTAG